MSQGGFLSAWNGARECPLRERRAFRSRRRGSWHEGSEFRDA